MSEYIYNPEEHKQEEIFYEQDRIEHLKEILEKIKTLEIREGASELITTLEKEILERKIRVQKLGGKIEE